MKKTNQTGRKDWPTLESDEAAEKFVAEADLTEYDWSAMTPTRFEFEAKSKQVNLRMPESQLEAIKAEAERRGVKYQRFMRDLMDRGLQSLRT